MPRISVTTLQQYNNYLLYGDDELKSKYYGFDALVNYITKAEPIDLESQMRMDVGTMYHNFIETGKMENYGLAIAPTEGYEKLREIRDEYIEQGFELYPIKQTKIYDGVEVVAKLDSYHPTDNIIVDQKFSKDSPDIDKIANYQSSKQADFYLDIFQADKLIFDLFTIGTWDRTQVTVESYSSTENLEFVKDFVKFLEIHELINYFIKELKYK